MQTSFLITSLIPTLSLVFSCFVLSISCELTTKVLDSQCSLVVPAGYRVMMRALHEALRERLGISDEPAEMMPHMRFRDMLAEAVRKDPAVGEVGAFEDTP